jgi:hypothetical protein
MSKTSFSVLRPRPLTKVRRPRQRLAVCGQCFVSADDGSLSVDGGLSTAATVRRLWTTLCSRRRQADVQGQRSAARRGGSLSMYNGPSLQAADRRLRTTARCRGKQLAARDNGTLPRDTDHRPQTTICRRRRQGVIHGRRAIARATAGFCDPLAPAPIFTGYSDIDTNGKGMSRQYWEGSHLCIPQRFSKASYRRIFPFYDSLDPLLCIFA